MTIEAENTWGNIFALQGGRGHKKPPESFNSWIQALMNPPGDTNLEDFNPFTTDMRPGITLRWRVFQQDVRELTKMAPRLPYSLVVLDPPYGFGKESWDSEAFTREGINQLISSFRFIDIRAIKNSADFIMNFVIFCSDQQLSFFLEEIQTLGYPCDRYVWCKPYTTTTS